MIWVGSWCCGAGEDGGEQSLEAMTSERDSVENSLLSLKNEYDAVVASCEKLRVDMSLAESAHQNDLSVLRGEKDAIAAELRRVSFRLDAVGGEAEVLAFIM
ncbi:hypothetical protein TcBrA4_0135840 [Trypanosoma cruzi]|nr:hypothetical protein TcBrA4_0135840 [Trypanosoma cruzi]